MNCVTHVHVRKKALVRGIENDRSRPLGTVRDRSFARESCTDMPTYWPAYGTRCEVVPSLVLHSPILGTRSHATPVVLVEPEGGFSPRERIALAEPGNDAVDCSA